MKELLPYATTIIAAIISGVLAYMSAIKKAKTDIRALQETNKFEIEKLMNQHRLDLEALERKHEMEIEKAKLEHEHKLELVQKEMENNLGTGAINMMLSEAMKTPEARQAIGQAFKSKQGDKRG